eukprot:scaffold1621_cov74-Skeletonema_dohrnii-CCMP3373.AAC.1
MHEARARESFHYHQAMHDAHRAATKSGSLSEDSGLYRCYHEKGVGKDSFVSSRHIFSVCDDGHLKVPSLDASKEVKLMIIIAELLAYQTETVASMGLELENVTAEYLVGSCVGCLEGFEVGEGDCRLVGCPIKLWISHSRCYYGTEWGGQRGEEKSLLSFLCPFQFFRKHPKRLSPRFDSVIITSVILFWDVMM